MAKTTQETGNGIKARCPLCDGTKAMFLYRKMSMYGMREVRMFAGSCTLCDEDGFVIVMPDAKQLAAHDLAVQS